MVIVCPECTTKFRVNPDRIPDRGAKVRCARCKHVFLAEKPSVAAAPTVQPFKRDQNLAKDNRIEAAVTAILSPTDHDELKTEHEEADAATESDFDYNSFREQDSFPKEESFTFSSDTAKSDSHKEAENQPQPISEEESFSFGEAREEPYSNKTDNFAFTEKKQPAAPAVEATASVTETVSAFTSTEEEPTEVALPVKPVTKPKGGVLSSIIRILLLLILGILILGGVLLYMNGPEQLEQVFQQLIGQQTDQSSDSGQIVLKDLQGKFIVNQEVGELFTIRGEAINKFKETRSSIQVKGVIFDQNGKPLLQKTVFCGNPISDHELQALPFNKIEELMGNQFGKSLSNMNVNQDQAIPFVIVFRDLPQSLAEFSADVTSSKPAAP